MKPCIMRLGLVGRVPTFRVGDMENRPMYLRVGIDEREDML